MTAPIPQPRPLVIERRLPRLLLWLKVGVAVGELVGGAVVVALVLVHSDPLRWVRTLALRELAGDPGDLLARGALASLPPLSARREMAFGLGVALYGGLKAGVVLAVLRGYAQLALAGALLFTALAATGAVVLLRHPTPIRAALGAVDAAVAAILWRETWELRRGGPP